MRKMNLQMYATPVQGKKLVYLFRVLEQAAAETGTLLGFVTENSRSTSIDADTTATKDGSIRSPGTPEITISSTSILPKDDTIIDTLEAAALANKMIECWEANLEQAGSAANTFKGMYYHGYITSIERTSSAEDNVEISIEYAVDGMGASGDVTVTAAQQAVAALVFADTTMATGASTGA